MQDELRLSIHAIRHALNQIEDPRRKQGRRYTLVSLLLLLVIGFLHEAKSVSAILDNTRHDKELLELLGQRRVPAAGTYTNLFKQLPLETINAALAAVGLALGWMSDHLAIDGKTIKGSQKGGVMLHFLNVATPQGLTLLQAQSEPAGGEIPAAEQALEGLDLEGRVVTADAMQTQRRFCQIVSKKKATTCSGSRRTSTSSTPS